MRRITTYRPIAAELPEIGTLATTRRGEVGQVIAHEEGQARLQFAGSIQGLYAADEITWQVVGTQTEGRWQTEGAELHIADRDYPELAEILGKPAPALVQEGNEWGHTAAKVAGSDRAYNRGRDDALRGDPNSAAALFAGGSPDYEAYTESYNSHSNLGPDDEARGLLGPDDYDIDPHGDQDWTASKVADRTVDGYNGQFWGDPGYGDERAHPRATIGSCTQCDTAYNDGTYEGTGILKDKVVDYHRCPSCGHQGTVPAKGTTASKTADTSNPNNTDGFSETIWDPFGEDLLKPGDCPACFGEGGFSDLNPDGKGFGEEHDCPQCGGSGRS